MLLRLREIEEQELLRRKQKYLEKLDAEVEAEKQRNLRLIELEAEKIKESSYRLYKNSDSAPPRKSVSPHAHGFKED